VSPMPLMFSGQGHAEDEDNKTRRMSERQEKRPEPFIMRCVNVVRSGKGGCSSGEEVMINCKAQLLPGESNNRSKARGCTCGNVN